MLFSDLPKVLISRRLDIHRGEASLTAMLVITFESNLGLVDEVAAELLGPTEAAYFSTLRFERRQKSYLLGRYAAKLALSQVLSEPNLKAIEVLKGVFDQPIVHCERHERWNVTLSHTESLAVALAYPAGHPMGIDVEQISQSRYETIMSELSSQETSWVKNSARGKHGVATALWSAKEALSKAITTGLMTPFQIYELAEFHQLHSGVLEVLFRNFAQYKARVWLGSSYVLSIALPKRSMIGEHLDLRAAL
jgi:4'-phosphopantetheinyl transferase